MDETRRAERRGQRAKNRDVNRDNFDKSSKGETNRFHSVVSVDGASPSAP